MTPQQTTSLAVIICALAVIGAVAWFVWDRRGGTFGRLERRLPRTPRHRADGPPEPVIYLEVAGIFTVVAAPERGLIPANLIARARNGTWPNLVMTHDENRGDVITFGIHDAGAGKVCYTVGGRDVERPELVNVVRVA